MVGECWLMGLMRMTNKNYVYKYWKMILSEFVLGKVKIHAHAHALNKNIVFLLLFTLFWLISYSIIIFIFVSNSITVFQSFYQNILIIFFFFSKYFSKVIHLFICILLPCILFKLHQFVHVAVLHRRDKSWSD